MMRYEHFLYIEVRRFFLIIPIFLFFIYLYICVLIRTNAIIFYAFFYIFVTAVISAYYRDHKQ